MNNRRLRPLFFVLTLVVFLAVALPAAGKGDQPHVISFSMRADEPGALSFSGATTGALAGELQARLMCVIPTGQKPCQHVMYHLAVAGVDGRSLTATLRGTCHVESGIIRLCGEVTDGYLKGSRITMRGRLEDAETGQYRGLIQVYEALEQPLGVRVNTLQLDKYLE